MSAVGALVRCMQEEEEGKKSCKSIKFSGEEAEPGVEQLLMMYRGGTATRAPRLDPQTTAHQPKHQGATNPVSSCRLFKIPQKQERKASGLLLNSAV